MNMSNNKIEAHKITKPIQLLAAWLVGLAIVNVSFLTAAANITQPSWVPGLLSVAAVINVPIFVVSIFLLQTKFRPEMQEDSYYSDYLNSKNNNTLPNEPSKPTDNIQSSIEDLSKKISALAESKPINFSEKVKELISDERVAELSHRYGNLRTLSELYIRPEYWETVVDEWGNDGSFTSEFDRLKSDELIIVNHNDIKSTVLTELGVNVSKYCEENKMLFSQNESEYFFGLGKSNKKRQADT